MLFPKKPIYLIMRDLEAHILSLPLGEDTDGITNLNTHQENDLNICLKKSHCPYFMNGFSSDADLWLKRIYCDSRDGYRWCTLFRRMADNLAVSEAIAPDGNVEPAAGE